MAYQDKKIIYQDFPVNQEYGDSEDFFRIITPYGEVQLPKLKFQKNQPLPATLNCRIKEIKNGHPILAHNSARYVSDFYADGFSKGHNFDFKVIRHANENKNDYILQDDNGLQFRLLDQKTPLTIGQSVKCRFDHLDQFVYILRRSESDTQLRAFNLREIGRFLNLKSWEVDKLERSLSEIPEMTEPMQEHAKGEPAWILHALRVVHQILPRWFNQAVATLSYANIRNILSACKSITLHMLQGSDFLRFIKGDERTRLQNELTAQIEQFDIYLEALEIISKKNQREFIHVLLSHLKESGYLYHPNIQFAIMMILFRQSPELVNSSLGNIFDTLMEWYPSTWKAEPFRQAFVDQLQIYISDTREDIDKFLIPETSEDNEKIEKVLTAIAIQQSLATDKDRVDIQRNMSLFYRCLSLLRTAKADVLLHKSYLTLMGVKLPTDFTWLDIKEPTMMMTRAAVDPPATFTLPESSKYYIVDNIEVEIGKNGITISLTDSNADGQVPNGMLPWPGLQVCAPVEHHMNRSRIRTLDGHMEFWNDVETSLFMPKNVNDQFPQARRAPDIDDNVIIEINRIIPSASEPGKAEGFQCKIVDENFLEGEGRLSMEDLVPYHVHSINLGTFRDDEGRPLRFEATVKDIDENDVIHFTLLDAARNAVRDLTGESQTCLAVITKVNERNYSAISDRGFGLYIHKDLNDEIPYHTRDVVKVEITSIDAYNYVQGKAIEGPLYGVTLDNVKSLQNLLRTIAINYDSSPTQEFDEEDLISAEDICEIINTLRYKAVSLIGNIVQAYDYLSYARVLARIIGDEKLAAKFKAHKEVLMLYQQYAKNKTLYQEDIDNAITGAPEDILIQRLAYRLSIVARLAHNEENHYLWEIVNGDSNDMEKELAQMVLTHNLLYELNHEDPCLSTIKESIAKTLNVSHEQRNLKYYGSESQYVEFKSSLVYPAQKGRKGLSVADPDKQEYEILHIIAGFLNTTGGTLYIGVADDHYERGLEEDLKFYKMDSSERNSLHRRNIRSIDKLANHLQTLIDNSFNIHTNAGDYAKTYIDDEASKGVIMVKVAPCPHVVTFDGKIFVRHGSRTVPLLTQDEIEQFKADRERLFEEQIRVQKEDSDDQLPTSEDISEEITTDIDSQDTATEAEYSDEAADEQIEEIDQDLEPDVLRTSRIRRNILHDYEDYEHFSPAIAYIRFTNDNQIVVTNDEWSLDESDLLDLAISEDEADQYLLLVYENEHAVKVPMDRILDKEKINQYQRLFDEKKLLFAVPIHANDALYSVHRNSKGTVYERITPVADISLANVNSVPSRILEAECAASDFYELVPAARIAEYESINGSNFKRNQLGSMAKGPANAKVLPKHVIKRFYENFDALA